ncbi:MAG: 3-isopropylmalate dehydrogenase [Gammaproteobacteria bacterium]|nr:3-isopropylmalate dehydrogenase [Gammaproteobacteria bacterium]MYJ53108.1 3-isopropylmalate dehydrogenase [Gammaproteobacteria bacterium]
MAFTVLALGGDGIGPEVLEASLKVLDTVARSARIPIDLEEDLLHGAAWDAYGVLIRPETLERARRSDALLVGAVGGPKWDDIVIEGGPEDQDGLMKLRRELDTFACIRHARAWDALIDRTPYLPGRVHGADIIVMRELCAGAMFTRTRGMDTTKSGERRAYDLNEYTDEQIRRFARIGFEIARRRTGRVVSVDKSNVFIAGKLWREAVDDVGRSEFPDIELTHLFADNAAYQLACRPADFDVVLADNLFGDLLSDQAGAISGSLGMLPSACLSDLPRTGRVQGPAIYEPVHGSAPDIAGQGIANPVGMILSVAMMLDYSMGAVKTARRLEAAVDRALASGYATRDLGGTHSTAEMTDAVIREFRSL